LILSQLCFSIIAFADAHLLFSQILYPRSGENVILEAKHMMYVDPSPRNYNTGLSPAQSLAPISLGVTDHHFLVLRPGQLQMMSSLSGQLVQVSACVRCAVVNFRCCVRDTASFQVALSERFARSRTS
jgi:hypothetical protein